MGRTLVILTACLWSLVAADNHQLEDTIAYEGCMAAASSSGSCTELSLPSQSLQGTIPQSMVCSLGGVILSLDLSYNEISGTIPWRDISDSGGCSWTALKRLWLTGNQISGTIGSELADMTSLTSLRLSFNHFEDPYDNPGYWFNNGVLYTQNLVELDVSDNVGLSGDLVPLSTSSADRLANVQYLNFARTSLSGTIPTDVVAMTSMQILDLSGTFLSGTLPSELGVLTGLTNLAVDTGAVPKELWCGIGPSTVLKLGGLVEPGCGGYDECGCGGPTTDPTPLPLCSGNLRLHRAASAVSTGQLPQPKICNLEALVGFNPDSILPAQLPTATPTTPTPTGFVHTGYKFSGNDEFRDALQSADCLGGSPATCDNIHQLYGHISEWDVSQVTDMSYAMQDASLFNQDIGGWNVASVTNMQGTFWKATNFNQDLSSWDTSAVTNMYGTFYQATNFNQDLSSWDTSAVTTMHRMLHQASSFNSDISAWDVSSVTSMHALLSGASSFNGDLSAWDVSSVTDMYGMIYQVSSFNADLSAWDVSSVGSMAYMFHQASSFNADLSAWDVSSVMDMDHMMHSASSFNGNISGWNTASVTNMNNMFGGSYGGSCSAPTANPNNVVHAISC